MSPILKRHRGGWRKRDQLRGKISTGIFTSKDASTVLYSCPIPPKPLVLGYECGRVFLAGVGPGSSWGDAANWLSSRFSRSVETRRRHDWLRMMFTRCASLPSSNLVAFGRWWHARGRGPLFRALIWWPSGGGGTREAGGTAVESMVYRVSTRHIL